MPYCCVPNCESNETTRNIDICYFNVPQDENLRMQWVRSIPGVNHLSGNQRVCSRHFDDSDILREYVAYDGTGKIIARVN